MYISKIKIAIVFLLLSISIPVYSKVITVTWEASVSTSFSANSSSSFTALPSNPFLNQIAIESSSYSSPVENVTTVISTATFNLPASTKPTDPVGSLAFASDTTTNDVSFPQSFGTEYQFDGSSWVATGNVYNSNYSVTESTVSNSISVVLKFPDEIPPPPPGWVVTILPEPEEYIMMLVGFSLVFYQVKRKRKEACNNLKD